VNEALTVCGRQFSPELLVHLQQLTQQEPPPSRNRLAQEACKCLAWFSPDGRMAVSSAKVALRKLHKRGALSLPPRAGPEHRKRHRLRPSGRPLPPIQGLPRQVQDVQGLHLYLIADHHDSLHTLWNDLMIGQHPCGDAPLVGAQMRYLIGSEHGWLGALGFGPAAFVLACRDRWIGWSTPARLGHLREVVGLSRVLIRKEVHCANLLSKVLNLAIGRLPGDWRARYGIEPRLLETFVDRSQYTGLSLSAANWRRVGHSTGRGRRGPKELTKSLKDVWLYPLDPQARTKLQAQPPEPLSPCPLDQSLSWENWSKRELQSLDLGDVRRNQRAAAILQARWNQPQASFYGSFESWTPAKGAYGLIEHRSSDIGLESLLAPHVEQTQRRMAAEPLVLLPQDTTTLNYTGLRQTTGLGPLGEGKGQGLWLHSLLAFRPDGVPLGVLNTHCWARASQSHTAQRNAQAITEKESLRWVEAFQEAAQAAGRMPQTQLVAINDREGDIYELHEAASQAPPNLHLLMRAQHDRQLAGGQKLWAFMASEPVGRRRRLKLPRGHGQAARVAQVQVRWAQVRLEAPAAGCKKTWPSLSLWVVWVHEPNPPAGVEGLDWMLLTDLPITHAKSAWEKVQWYCRRWGIEEWHRALKNGCQAEQREFKTAEHLQRVLAFDLIVAWRVLACVKLGRALPQLPATVLYSEQELRVLLAATKKNESPKLNSAA
jgi:Domain of unknown function (DUF4338)/Transposase DNA-binding